jgi:hypothetical protein
VGRRSCPSRLVRTGHTGHILCMFFKNTSNIFEYARIYSNISLSGGRKGLSGKMGRWAGGQSRRAAGV